MFRVLILFPIMISIIGCDNKDDVEPLGSDAIVSNQINNSEDNNTQDILETTDTDETQYEIRNRVELGPVAYANVKIFTTNREIILYETTTNDNGIYEIDRTKLLENVDSVLSERPSFVLIESTGGIDIDPNDDGIRDESRIEVLGKVKGLVDLNTLLTTSNLSINLLSTVIAEIIEEEITEDKLTNTIINVGASDIDNNGVINNLDILKYQMAEDESNLESELRESILEKIHDNTVSTVIRDIQANYGVINYSYQINDDDTAIIQLSSTTPISYKLNAKKGDLLTSVYESPISLSKNEYLVYRSCNNQGNCSPVSLISFNGREVKPYSSMSVSGEFGYNLNTLNSVMESIGQEIEQYMINQEQISQDYPNSLTELETMILEAETQIEAISSSIEAGL